MRGNLRGLDKLQTMWSHQSHCSTPTQCIALHVLGSVVFIYNHSACCALCKVTDNWIKLHNQIRGYKMPVAKQRMDVWLEQLWVWGCYQRDGWRCESLWPGQGQHCRGAAVVEYNVASIRKQSGVVCKAEMASTGHKRRSEKIVQLYMTSYIHRVSTMQQNTTGKLQLFSQFKCIWYPTALQFCHSVCCKKLTMNDVADLIERDQQT